MMVKYTKKKSTGSKGINYVKDVIDHHNCIFIDTPTEEIGIDCFVELVENEKPLNKIIAIQVKAGSSYYKNTYSVIPIGNHYNYWNNYPLPVFGVVVMPHHKKEEEAGYWVDIKEYLENNPDAKTIKFENTPLNKFDRPGFKKLFLSYVLKRVPGISFSEALKLMTEEEYKVGIAVMVLLEKFHNEKKTWDFIINYFFKNEASSIPANLILALSFIPWHPDLSSRFIIDNDIREYAKSRIEQFGIEEIIKLFNFVDEENMISRGSLGQCVEAITSVIPLSRRNQYLKEILLNKSMPEHYRNVSAILYAFYNVKDSLPILKKAQYNMFISELINYIEETGFLNPYA